MIIAYQGVPGAFGHQAAMLVDPVATHLACNRFADVAQRVGDGRAEVGVLPLENHYVGEVEGVADLIASSGVVVDRLFDVPVRLHLLAVPGATLDSICRVYSHPMALKQCRENLRRLRLEPVEAVNTAVAAQSLDDATKAALASTEAAKIYGRIILLQDLQDDPDNRTTFALIKPR